jgi:hypothetical protein
MRHPGSLQSHFGSATARHRPGSGTWDEPLRLFAGRLVSEARIAALGSNTDDVRRGVQLVVCSEESVRFSVCEVGVVGLMG